MKVILNIKRHNKDANGFCKEVDMTLVGMTIQLMLAWI